MSEVVLSHRGFRYSGILSQGFCRRWVLSQGGFDWIPGISAGQEKTSSVDDFPDCGPLFQRSTNHNPKPNPSNPNPISNPNLRIVDLRNIEQSWTAGQRFQFLQSLTPLVG